MSQSPSRSKAIVITGFAILIVVGIVVSLRLWVFRNIHEPLQQRAADITAALKAKGAQVGEPKLADSVPGVDQIVTLEIDGRPVRLLFFDQSNEAHTRELQRIHQEHKTKVLGADQPAEDEGSVIILDFENHPRKDEILESFRQRK